MTSKERIQATINHREPDKVAVDFGGTGQTGIHVEIVEKLRSYFGLEQKPIKVIEPFQMLGEIEPDLLACLGGDAIPLNGPYNMFGIEQNDWTETKTYWGQTVLMAGGIGHHKDEKGEWIVYPQGDTSVEPSSKMPRASYFFDAIHKPDPKIDDATLKVEDNLEEFGQVSEDTLSYWKTLVDQHENSDKALIANFGGTSLGDVALVPGISLKHPKGIRDVTEWYMSSMLRPNFVREIFDKQTDIALENLKKIYGVVGNRIEGIFLCGTDFGTQISTFSSVDDFRSVWMPYYQKVSSWVHENTNWKLFKHSCGAVETLIESFIEAGIDLLNPVQISATGMDPKTLKEKYGDRIVFWGGGVDTQHTLAFGKPQDVEKEVLNSLEIFGNGGGYVFNTVHNTQAKTPIENFIAMINAVRKFNGEAKV